MLILYVTFVTLDGKKIRLKEKSIRLSIELHALDSIFLAHKYTEHLVRSLSLYHAVIA